MEVSTALTLLTVNLIVLSLVIILVIIAVIVLAVKLNKIASNVQRTTTKFAHIAEWLSPAKVFSEFMKAFSKRK